MTKRKSWREKLTEKKDLPKVVSLKGEAKRQWKADTVAIPSPMEIKKIMDGVPKGRLITINEIRGMIAKKHRADIGCPLTCGIFSWIVAHAAEEEASEGKKRITPYWRTLKAKGELNPKYPCGIEGQKRHLESEGFRVIQKGKRLFVKDYEKYLVRA